MFSVSPTLSEYIANVKMSDPLVGPHVLYNGTIGEKSVKDVTEVGGILTVEDLPNY
jgi:gamma-glutamyltranspeptidase